MKAVQVVVLMVLLTTLGLMAVWQRVRIIHLGYSIRALELQERQLQLRNEQLVCEIGVLSAPEALAERLRRHGIELTKPQGLEKINPRGQPQPGNEREASTPAAGNG